MLGTLAFATGAMFSDLTLAWRLLSSVMPPVTAFGCDAGVTRLAQRHEIVGTAATTFGERENMVHLLGGCQLTMLPTLFAQWMRLDISVAYAFPCTTISFVGFRLTLEMIIMTRCLPLMLRAIQSVRQLGTAGVLTRPLWFLRHEVTSLGHNKSPGGLLPRGSALFWFPKYILSQRTT